MTMPDGLGVGQRLLRVLEQARQRVVGRDGPGAPEVGLALGEGAGAAAAVEGEDLVLRRAVEHDAEVVGVGRELGRHVLAAELGDGGLAGGGVARLVVEVDEVDLRTAGRLDVLGGEVQPTRHGLAVERTGAGQGQHGPGVDRHALARRRRVDAQQRPQVGDGRAPRPSCRPPPWSPPRPTPRSSPRRPTRSSPRCRRAVVAVLLPELSLPQAARTLGVNATAAPAAPRRVSTCRRVTRPWCTGRSGSMSVIPTAPCVVAGRPARHAQRNSGRALLDQHDLEPSTGRSTAIVLPSTFCLPPSA